MVMVATRVTPPPYSTSRRLLRCIIFSGPESGSGQKRLSNFATTTAGLALKADATAHGR